MQLLYFFKYNLNSYTNKQCKQVILMYILEKKMRKTF